MEPAGLKRGEIVMTSLAGDYGKPRPAVIVQSDRLASLASVLVCPLTSDLANAEPIRVPVAPTSQNGLRFPSQIMVEKMTGVHRGRCREVIGRLEEDVMLRFDETLALVTGLAD